MKKQFLSDKEVINLIKKYQNQRDIKARNKIIENFYYLIIKISGDISESCTSSIFNINDFISYGVIGLIKAIEKYKDLDNVKPSTFFYIKIKGSIQDSLRALTRSRIKNKISFISLDNFIGNEESNNSKNTLLDFLADSRYSDNYDLINCRNIIKDFYNKNIINKKKVYIKTIFEEYFFNYNEPLEISIKHNINNNIVYYHIQTFKKKLIKELEVIHERI